MRLIRALARVVHLPASLILSGLAVLAVLGFALPLLDALNHFQPLWFVGTLVALLLTGSVYRRPLTRALMIAIAATGFLASAVIVVPEAAARLVPHEAPQGRSYTLLDFNVFGLNDDMPRVAAMIGRVNPDIITFQEYFPEQRLPLHPLLVADYPYHVICAGARRANIAIYSRLPFADAGGGACRWGKDRRTAVAVARLALGGGRRLAIATTQNDWPVQVSQWRGGPAAMTARQRGELDHVAAVVNAIADPVILSGDFNSTSWSYALKSFAVMSGMTRQTHSLFTWPKLLFLDAWRDTPAFLPLDHVFTRGDIAVSDIRTGAASGSDHLPVVMRFSVGG